MQLCGYFDSGTASLTWNDDEMELLSRLRETIVKNPGVEWSQVVGEWSDVAGLEGAKKVLKQGVIFPIKFPHVFTGERKTWKGILFFWDRFKPVGRLMTNKQPPYTGLPERVTERNAGDAGARAQADVWVVEVLSKCSDNESETARRIKTEFQVQMEEPERRRIEAFEMLKINWIDKVRIELVLDRLDEGKILREEEIGCVVTLRTGRPGFDPRQGQRIFPLAFESRPALGPPPIQWVPGSFPWGKAQLGCDADHSPPSSAEIKNE
ncbi:Vacuolar protein sorting-associated protein 4B [Zootermopsis nevadensis]|uniref:Vacuolar protein sorting-associated protein 4B n=1 Tax=Zootermopsis nevadensis TaxID=136037 RepID=A0A067QW98_ZOONE|nr:Vacuolar protein sorting-associated protein 4B [Zootermopsis nevadensis]